MVTSESVETLNSDWLSALNELVIARQDKAGKSNGHIIKHRKAVEAARLIIGDVPEKEIDRTRTSGSSTGVIIKTERTTLPITVAEPVPANELGLTVVRAKVMESVESWYDRRHLPLRMGNMALRDEAYNKDCTISVIHFAAEDASDTTGVRIPGQRFDMSTSVHSQQFQFIYSAVLLNEFTRSIAAVADSINLDLAAEL